MAVAVFIPVDSQAMAKRGVKDFFMVGRVEMLSVVTMQTEGLEVAVVQANMSYSQRLVEAEVEEGILGEAVDIVKEIPVEEEEDLIMKEKTSKTNVVTIQLVPVR